MPGKRPRAPIAAEVWDRALEHRGLIGRVAPRYLGLGLDLDDLTQEGLFGLCRAVELYRADLGEWPPYAMGWIAAAMRDAIREGQLVRAGRVRRTSRTPPRPMVLARRGVQALPPNRTGPSDLADRLDLRAGLATLDHRSRAVLAANFGLGGRPARPTAAIAADLGLTRQGVDAIRRRALGDLRRFLDGSD
jgi:RNA polymerase sigma factor (sigma-70 family)